MWKSDGTAAGTVLVKDIYPGNISSEEPLYLTVANGTLFFSADNGITGIELWALGPYSGVEQLNSTDNTLNLYPNPASDIVTFITNNTNNEDVILNLYNSLGSLVKSEKLIQNKSQINVKDLSNGIYLFTTVSKNRIENKKLIIQK